MPQTPEYTVRLRTPHERQREKETPEPLTSAKASVLLGKNDTGRKPGHPEGYPHPSTPRRLPIYPYTSVMADEDTVLEEAMASFSHPLGRCAGFVSGCVRGANLVAEVTGVRLVDRPAPEVFAVPLHRSLLWLPIRRIAQHH